MHNKMVRVKVNNNKVSPSKDKEIRNKEWECRDKEVNLCLAEEPDKDNLNSNRASKDKGVVMVKVILKANPTMNKDTKMP
jgi:hypothetical protein